VTRRARKSGRGLKRCPTCKSRTLAMIDVRFQDLPMSLGAVTGVRIFDCSTCQESSWEILLGMGRTSKRDGHHHLENLPVIVVSRKGKRVTVKPEELRT
jgi:hypothetical protein